MASMYQSRWRESIVRSIQTLASMTPGGLASSSSSSLFDLHIDLRLCGGIHSPTEIRLFSWAYRPEMGQQAPWAFRGFDRCGTHPRTRWNPSLPIFFFVEKRNTLFRVFCRFQVFFLFERLRNAQISKVVPYRWIDTDG